jgi:hypothetical protein
VKSELAVILLSHDTFKYGSVRVYKKQTAMTTSPPPFGDGYGRTKIVFK